MNKKTIRTLKTIAIIELILIFIASSLIIANAYRLENKPSILVIEVHGEIIGDSNPYKNVWDNNTFLVSATKIVKDIQKYEKDDQIKAFILDIESNGGDGYGLKELEKQFSLMKKPVVSVVRDQALSSGYYVASATDRIFASELSNIADMGHVTIMEYSKHNGPYKKCYISSSEFKGMYYDDCEGFEHTEAYQNEKRELINQTEIMAAKVAASRNLSEKQVLELSDGTVFMGIGALKLGLIDQIGDTYDAKVWLEKQLGTKLELVYYRELNNQNS